MKKKTLSITIIDDNNFYAAGLALALSIYLENKKIKAKFLSASSKIKTADVIFQAIRSGTFIVPHPQTNGFKPLYIAIADRKEAHLQHLYRDIKKTNILYRYQTVNHVLQRIENTFFTQNLSVEQIPLPPEAFTHEPLTPREREVLFHLKKGKTPAGAAISMGVKVKTISSHKRAAMKKLNFRRTNELFHWMLQGGLSRHQPIKGH